MEDEEWEKKMAGLLLFSEPCSALPCMLSMALCTAFIRRIMFRCTCLICHAPQPAGVGRGEHCRLPDEGHSTAAATCARIGRPIFSMVIHQLEHISKLTSSLQHQRTGCDHWCQHMVVTQVTAPAVSFRTCSKQCQHAQPSPEPWDTSQRSSLREPSVWGGPMPAAQKGV